MATALIRVDQSGHPTLEIGTPGVSRDDIVLSTQVQLANQDDTGVRSRRWTLLSKPTGSTAVLSSPTDAAVTFTPDIIGTYRVRLIVNEGRAGEVDTRLVAIRDSSGLRIPAAGEVNEANWGGNARGWHPDMELYLQSITSANSVFSVKNGARLATDAALPAHSFDSGNGILTASANGALTVDGNAVALDDRIVVKNEGGGTSVENGLFRVSQVGDAGNPWILVRTLDADEDGELVGGMFVTVSEGAANDNTAWFVTTDDPIAVNTTAITWDEFPITLPNWAATLAVDPHTASNNPTVTVGDAIKWEDAQGTPAVRAEIDYDDGTSTWRTRIRDAAAALLTTLAFSATTGNMTFDGAIDVLQAKANAYEFNQVAANPGGVPTNTLYQDDGTNFAAGTLVWSNALAVSGALLLAGAKSGDAVAGINDVVIGDGTGDSGITLFCDSVAGVATLGFSDVSGGTPIADIHYLHTSNLMRFRIAGGDQGEFNSVSFRPTTDGGISLGTTGRRFSDVWGTTLYLAGALATNGVAGATDQVVGDGSGNAGQTYFVDGAAGAGKWSVIDTSATEHGYARYRPSVGTWDFATNAGNIRFQINSAGIRGSADGADDCGQFGAAWAEGHFGNIFLAGADVGDAAAGADQLVFGDGSAADFGQTFFFTLGNKGELAWNDGINQRDGAQYYNGFAFTLRTQNVDRFELNETEMKPLVTSIDLGHPTAFPWDSGFITALHLGGGAVGDGVTNATDEVIGGGSGEHGLTIFAGAASVASGIYWTGASGVDQASFVHDIANTRFIWRSTSGTGRMSLETNRLQPGVDGAQALARTQTSGWAALSLTERADHFGTPTATRAEVWLRSDAPPSLMLTDDDANDRNLSRMVPFTLDAQNAMLPSTGGPQVGTTLDMDTLEFTNLGGSSQFAYWHSTMPWTYGGQDIVVRLFWFFVTDVPGMNVVWQVAFERHPSALDLTASSFASAQTATVDPPSATNSLIITDITFTAAQIDSVVAGESFRLYVLRDPGHASDDWTQSAFLLKAVILET